MFLGSSHAQPRDLPDIVLILADDLGYGDLGCYGATQVSTPHIDGIAERGIRFTDAHSPSSVCSPTRYAILTGRHPAHGGPTRFLEFGEPLVVDPGDTTLASVARDAGYATAFLGKWHLGLGSEEDDLRPGPLELGFDLFLGFDRLKTFGNLFWIRDHDWVSLHDGRPEKIDPRERMVAVEARVPLSEVSRTLVRQATEFFESAVDRPVFLYLAPYQVHKPYTVAPEFEGTSGAGIYGDCIQELDWMVGEILDALARTRGRENTLLIFTSDNGAVRGPMPGWNGHRPNGDLRGGKAQIWEGGHRVPFVAQWPGHIPPGTTSDVTISLTGLLSTVASVTGAEGVDRPDSRDLLPSILGRPLESQARETTVFLSNGARDRAIRRGEWKLVFLRDGTRELYHLGDDPGERVDRAQEQPELVQELTGRMEAFERGAVGER